jgi:hypothetical protein
MVAHLSKADKNDADGTAPRPWGTEFKMHLMKRREE